MYEVYPDLERILQAETNLEFLDQLRAYLATRSCAVDLTKFTLKAKFRKRDSQEALSELAAKLLPEGKRSGLCIDFAKDILLFRIRLKLKSITELFEGLEEFDFEGESADYQSAINSASVMSSLDSTVDGLPLENGTTYAPTQTCSVDIVAGSTIPVTSSGLTPIWAYNYKYAKKVKPDQYVQDMIRMNSVKEEIFLLSLDSYLARRRQAGNLWQLLPEVIDHKEQYRVLQAGEGKHFPAFANLASRMLPDDQSCATAVAIAWILQRRYLVKKNIRIMTFWKTLSEKPWHRCFFRTPNVLGGSMLSVASSHIQASTQASTSSSVSHSWPSMGGSWSPSFGDRSRESGPVSGPSA
jgi:hypothetical protein